MLPEHPEPAGRSSKYDPLNVIDVAAGAGLHCSEVWILVHLFWSVELFLILSLLDLSLLGHLLLLDYGRVSFKYVFFVLHWFSVDDMYLLLVLLQVNKRVKAAEVLHAFVKRVIVLEAYDSKFYQVISNSLNVPRVFYNSF